MAADDAPSDDPAAAPPGWDARAARVLARCDDLAACSDAPHHLERVAFGDGMARAHERVRGWMRDAGLEPRLDAIGNLRGRPVGTPADAPTVFVGSHLDSVVDAGRYDGALGVLAAIELADALGGASLPLAIEAVAFCDEEGVRFGSTYFGSQALAGRFDPAMLDLEDADGVSLRSAIRAFGGAPERIDALALDASRARAFVELHIEQGRRLEQVERSVGTVDTIVGQTKLEVVVKGRAAHAGTTPMRERHDALAAAADIVLAVEAMGREEPDAVATVGRLDVRPNASNVVPAEARFSVDIRHRRDAVREQLAHNVLEAAQVAARSRGIEVFARTLLAEPARPLDPELHAWLCDRGGALPLSSYAGHDAAVMATCVPTALLFVRSPGGISHHPDEAVEAADLARALETAAGLITHLAVDASAARAP